MHSLVADLAKAACVMRPICVLTLSCLLLVAFAEIAEVAHELGSVLAVVVATNVKTLQTLEYFF